MLRPNRVLPEAPYKSVSSPVGSMNAFCSVQEKERRTSSVSICSALFTPHSCMHTSTTSILVCFDALLANTPSGSAAAIESPQDVSCLHVSTSDVSSCVFLQRNSNYED